MESKNSPGGACAQNSPEKCAVRSPDGHYCAHIATVYDISLPPLSQNPLSAPAHHKSCHDHFQEVVD